MSLIPPATAAWLKAQAYYVSAAGPGGWGERAITSEIISPIVDAADAQAEAARQAAFIGPAMVVDMIDVPGLRVDLLGCAVTIRADRGGYDVPVTVFVIGVAEQDDREATRLTVLRRL